MFWNTLYLNTKNDVHVCIKLHFNTMLILLMLYSNSNVRNVVHGYVVHISFSFQMVEHLQIIMFLLYTFVLPVDLIDPGKKIFDLLSFYTSDIVKVNINFK